jgi:hypothetical protein
LEEGRGSSIIRIEGNMGKKHGSLPTIRVREEELVIEINIGVRAEHMCRSV